MRAVGGSGRARRTPGWPDLRALTWNRAAAPAARARAAPPGNAVRPAPARTPTASRGRGRPPTAPTAPQAPRPPRGPVPGGAATPLSPGPRLLALPGAARSPKGARVRMGRSGASRGEDLATPPSAGSRPSWLQTQWAAERTRAVPGFWRETPQVCVWDLPAGNRLFAGYLRAGSPPNFPTAQVTCRHCMSSTADKPCVAQVGGCPSSGPHSCWDTALPRVPPEEGRARQPHLTHLEGTSPTLPQ